MSIGSWLENIETQLASIKQNLVGALVSVDQVTADLRTKPETDAVIEKAVIQSPSDTGGACRVAD